MTSQASSEIDDLGFDPDALRERYRLEREKRLRPDGNRAVHRSHRRFLEVRRRSLHRRRDRARAADRRGRRVARSAGASAACRRELRLREAGVEDICLVEKGGDFGGTWYWNRYPGAQCDIESYVYLPLLEELELRPEPEVRKCPGDPRATARRSGSTTTCTDNALFQTEVTAMAGTTKAARWIVSTNRGRCGSERASSRWRTDRCIAPSSPASPGINDYKGHTFHTSRWDYDYTGGEPGRRPRRLRDKRVAIIGTGATAVQCVPHVGETAEAALSSSSARHPASTSGTTRRRIPNGLPSLEPGWHRKRMENFNALLSGVPQAEDLVNDGWTSLIGKMVEMFKRGSRRAIRRGSGIAEIMELANFEKMNEIRARAEELVADPNT